MTTVVDPTGAPVPVYNRSGTTIVNLTVASTPPDVPIPRSSGWTVAVITSTASGVPFVVLPSGAEIGDVVEVHLLPPSSSGRVNVVPPAGETAASFEVSVNNGRIWRKVSSTNWVVVGPAA